MAFQDYIDIGNDSGVHQFEIAGTYIRIIFKDKLQWAYRYSYSSAGQLHVDEMKYLALTGDGLNTYINQNTYHNFESIDPLFTSDTGLPASTVTPTSEAGQGDRF
jgi:hypothetical protein